MAFLKRFFLFFRLCLAVSLYSHSHVKEACGHWGADPHQHLERSGLLKVHASWDHQGAAESQSCPIQAQHEHHLRGQKRALVVSDEKFSRVPCQFQNSLLIFFFRLRAPRCPCLDPAAAKASGTAVTLTTGERGTVLETDCRVTPSSPLLSTAQRGSRTSLVSYVSVVATLQGPWCIDQLKHWVGPLCKHQGLNSWAKCFTFMALMVK